MMSPRGIRPNAGFGENESFLPVGLQPEGPPDAQMIQKSHGFPVTLPTGTDALLDSSLPNSPVVTAPAASP